MKLKNTKRSTKPQLSVKTKSKKSYKMHLKASELVNVASTKSFQLDKMAWKKETQSLALPLET